MDYEIVSCYRHNDRLRASFNALAKETFCLDFENWYLNGYWNEKYNPHSVVVDGKIVSNISVNHIDCTVGGKDKQYIQLGTVMTNKAYRNKGLARLLIEKVLDDYRTCDGFFLYANKTVLNFYPKFGFRKQKEFNYSADIKTNGNGTATSLAMKTKADFNAFLKLKNERQSLGAIKLDTDDLIMFYLTQFMTDCVYYIKELDAVVIAKLDGKSLLIYDIYAKMPFAPLEVTRFFKDIKKAEFLFVPENTDGLLRHEVFGDDTFFVRGERLAEDINKIDSFSVIAHA